MASLAETLEIFQRTIFWLVIEVRHCQHNFNDPQLLVITGAPGMLALFRPFEPGRTFAASAERLRLVPNASR
jgi:hypothetical protein